MDRCCKFDSEDIAKEKLNREMTYYLPVIAGVATHDEISQMTAEQLGIAIEAAKMKIKLFGKGD